MSLQNESRGIAVRASAALVGCAIAVLVHGCGDIEAKPLQPSNQSALSEPGAVGAPCAIGDERSPGFSGFRVAEAVISTNDFVACQSGICLANHFQGRVSCPLGQAAPTPCGGPADTGCEGGAACVEAGVVAIYCDPQAPDGGASYCASHGGVCDAARSACACNVDADCLSGAACDSASHQCKQYVCHVPGACQAAGASEADNAGKACCVVGSDIPVTASVCGQCAQGSGRDAEAVHCSCRCGPAAGAPPDPDAEYCSCPSGFSCEEVFPYVGLGDPSIPGKYCVRQGAAYQDTAQCGAVSGHYEEGLCDGDPASP